MIASNLAELFQFAARTYKNRKAFLTRNSAGDFDGPTFHELFEMGLDLAAGLIDLGVVHGDRVGLIADNRLEWILADYATLIAGAADVPRGTDSTDQELVYILNHAECEVAFVENTAVAERLLACREQLPKLRTLIVLTEDSGLPAEHTIGLGGLMRTGAAQRQAGRSTVDARMRQINPGDLFTVIYTSGTTGEPKGVMLTHAAMLSQIGHLPLNVSQSDRIVSILPVWHIFERVFEMIAIARGCATHYSSVRRLKEDLARVRPTFMASAPRLWDSVHAGVQTKMAAASPVARGLFRAALYCAGRFRGALRFLRGQELDLHGRSLGTTLSRGALCLSLLPVFVLPALLLDFVVLRKVRKATGGALRASVSGGGALPQHVDEFFNNIGIPVLEGYGLTETCPVIAVRSLSRLVIGTVGPLYANTELRLVDPANGAVLYSSDSPASGRGVQGEIHVRGPQVMQGYFRNPDATRAVLSEDGWLNTGDLGLVTYNDCLKIVGRSKETIVLLGGENVEPVPIENRLSESPLIDFVMVVGQDRKFLGAVVVPSVAGFAAQGDSLPGDVAGLARHPEVRAAIQREIKRLVSKETGFKSFERVVDFVLLPASFEVGDELTAKLSLKRHNIVQKYADTIESIWSREPQGAART